MLEKERKHFDKVIDDYEAVSGSDKIADKHIISKMFQEVSKILNESDVVLEVGCGAGIHTISIAERCKHIVAMDLSSGPLKRVKEKIHKGDISNIEVIEGIAEMIALRDNVFDRVVCIGLLHHLITIAPAISEIERVLKPGGSIIIIEPNANNPYIRFVFKKGIPLWRRMLSESEHPIYPGEIIDPLEKHRMNIEKCNTMGYIPRFTPQTILPCLKFIEKNLESSRFFRNFGGFVVVTASKRK